MTKEQQAVQAIHAGILAGKEFKPPDETHLVVLSIGNEEKLENLQDYLYYKHNIKFVSFIEPDLDNSLTAIATEPIYDSKHRKVFKKYKLLQLGD